MPTKSDGQLFHQQFSNPLLTRKTGDPWLKLGKVFGNVAAFAHLTKAAIVNIFIAMTSHTRKRCIKRLFHRCPMALQTASFHVSTIELVLGAAIMVKIP